MESSETNLTCEDSFYTSEEALQSKATGLFFFFLINGTHVEKRKKKLEPQGHIACKYAFQVSRRSKWERRNETSGN